MVMALSRFSQWLWPGSRSRRAHELPSSTALTSSLFPDFPSGFREPGAVRYPNVASAGAGARRSRPRKAKNRRRSRGELRVDKEHDMVIVPSDGGGCLSGSESDDSDWSIGWLEPQAPGMQSDGDSEGSFAVLVPCYRHGRVELPERSEERFVDPQGLAGDGISDGKNFVEQWLSSLQN